MTMPTHRKRTVFVSSCSQPTEPGLTGFSISQMVGYYARVTNPENQYNTMSMPKLLDFLVRQKHWSPFQMVNVNIGVTIDRSTAHQLLRHSSIPIQETSQRYRAIADIEPFTWEARLTGATNRQGSLDAEDNGLQHVWVERQMVVWNAAIEAYLWAIEQDIAPECARAVLPEGMTPTTMYLNGTLRSWIHYLDQRLDSHAQKEHQELAQAIRAAMIENSPDLEAILPKGNQWNPSNTTRSSGVSPLRAETWT